MLIVAATDVTIAARVASQRSRNIVARALHRYGCAAYTNLLLPLHSQPSDGPFNSSDGYGYILLM